MDPIVGASLVSGGVSLLGNLFNVGTQSEANETNLQIARENRDFYLQQWKRENAYNDPSAMMQRLARAGLNPNLMYGDGASGMPAAASMPSVENGRVVAPQMDPLSMAQAANIAADTMLKKSQAAKSESDIKVNEGQIKVSDTVALYNSALTSFTKAQQDYCVGQTRMLGDLTRELNAKIAATYAGIQNMNNNTYLHAVEVGLKSKEVDALCAKYESETELNKEQLKYVGALSMAKIRNLDADSLLKSMQVQLTGEQIVQARKATLGMSISNAQALWNLNLDLKFSQTERRLKQAQFISECTNNILGNNALGLINAGLKQDYFTSGLKHYGVE